MHATCSHTTFATLVDVLPTYLPAVWWTWGYQHGAVHTLSPLPTWLIRARHLLPTNLPIVVGLQHGCACMYRSPCGRCLQSKQTPASNSLPIVQSLVKLRRLRYGLHKDDVTVVLLGDEDLLGPNGRSPAPLQPGYKPSVSFLVLRCAKNYGSRPLPLPQQP
jgi:hypothetical protein